MDLRLGAGVAVQEEALGGVGGGQALLDHRVGHGVGDVLALVHVLLGLLAQLGGPRRIGAEDIAGGDGRDGQALGDPSRLGALARPGGAEENHAYAHERNPS